MSGTTRSTRFFSVLVACYALCLCNAQPSAPVQRLYNPPIIDLHSSSDVDNEKPWCPEDPLHSKPDWLNSAGGPALRNPLDGLLRLSTWPPNGPLPPPAPPCKKIDPTPDDVYSYVYSNGYLASGSDIMIKNVCSLQEAERICSSILTCHGFTFNESAANFTNQPTAVYFKTGGRHGGSSPWSTYYKVGKYTPAAINFTKGGFHIHLRQDTYTVQMMNISRPGGNVSFVPRLTTGSALPLIHHLGDVTMRLRRSQQLLNDNGRNIHGSNSWDFYSSAWGPGSAKATAVPLKERDIVAHDITALLNQTNTSLSKQTPSSFSSSHQARESSFPLKVERAFSLPEKGPGLAMSFRLTNMASYDVEIGAFGMSMPSAGGTGNIETNVLNDAHVGSHHGWVQWSQIVLTEQTMIATPLNNRTRLEVFRPIIEYGGGGWEWGVHSKAWAEEWEENKQFPFLWMAESLNQTGYWPYPKSPWPSWKLSETFRNNISTKTHWNPPTSTFIKPGETLEYGVLFSAAPSSTRSRDQALVAVNQPVLRAIPGYTISTDMTTCSLLVSLPPELHVITVQISDNSLIHVGFPKPHYESPYYKDNTVLLPIKGISRGRVRLAIQLSDGTEAIAHYYVLPPLPDVRDAVGHHWANVAWLPASSKDPFGRGESIMPYDREDRKHRMNDARAYDVGLSDDAGGGNPLGFAMKVGHAPTEFQVSRLDAFINNTLYGIKPDSAKPPYKSLQYPHPNNGIRMTMFYYNQTYFPYNYTEGNKCANSAGLDNWCMTEAYSNATYRGFNYPHQIASYYNMYRIARYHTRIKTLQNWEWYLARAANTTIRLGAAQIGFMDGTVQREVLRSVLEENMTAGVNSTWDVLGSAILKNQKSRAVYWSTAKYPYGSEFSYDTTGQEEVVVWLLYFGFDSAANKTVNHVLSYMRSIPNWAYMGGADATDVGNGGKWFTAAETGFSPYCKMHYRAGLNQIPLVEWFRLHPDYMDIVEIIVGAISGQYTNIDKTGAPSMLFHAYPYVMEHDPNSGDYGLGYFGTTLETGSYFILHPEYGPLCYLCDLNVNKDDGDRTMVNSSSSFIGTLYPRDAYRMRVYLEPIGVWIQADTGNIEQVLINLTTKQVLLVFQPAKDTAAKFMTYDYLRLRVDKVSRKGVRPGDNVRVSNSTAVFRRDAYEVPAPKSDQERVTLSITWD